MRGESAPRHVACQTIREHEELRLGFDCEFESELLFVTTLYLWYGGIAQNLLKILMYCWQLFREEIIVFWKPPFGASVGSKV
jgi:hypothetical protein